MGNGVVSKHLCSPNEDFGTLKNRWVRHFVGTFHTSDYSIWAKRDEKCLQNVLPTYFSTLRNLLLGAIKLQLCSVQNAQVLNKIAGRMPPCATSLFGKHNLILRCIVRMSSERERLILTFQCPNSQDIVWDNGHNTTCFEISTLPYARGDWTDRQGRLASAYCKKIANVPNNNCPMSAPQTSAPQTSAPQTSAPSALDRYKLGEKGQSCSEVCTNAGRTCTEFSQGTLTYGRDIVYDMMRKNGIQEESGREDEWQNNFRKRDGYTYTGSEFFAVPGFWVLSNGNAAPNWKNGAFNATPSTCGARWGDMRRVCACD